MSHQKYIFGAAHEEQERLLEQQRLFGDAEFLQFKNTDTVCEVGCGSGANVWVASTLNHGHYIGIDYQPEQIQFARNQAKQQQLNNVEFYCADAYKLPLADNSVDAVFCRLLLIHTADPLKIIKEMQRITRPGGLVLAIDADVLAYKTTKPALQKCLTARIHYMYQISQGTIDVAPRLNNFLEHAGLTQIEMIQHDIFVSGKTDKPKLERSLINWNTMNKPVADKLVANGLLSREDLQQAEQEVSEVTEEDSIYQRLWIARGIKVDVANY